ncbi:MAG: AtpZ/AtpI family protein [Balneola sp.]
MRLPEEYAKYLGLGAEIAASLIIPISLGYLVDIFLNTSPYGVLIGAVLGIGIFFTLIFKIAQNFGKKEDQHLEKDD